MTPKSIRVTIDRLVLRGFPAHQRDAIAAALIAELERELGRAPGTLGASRSEHNVRAAPLKLTGGSGAKEIGAAAGRGLARSLRR
jgi:hypothetical protein